MCVCVCVCVCSMEHDHSDDRFTPLLTVSSPPPPPLVPAGRGPIQLWQFLLDLLLSPDKQNMINWTRNGYEFCILQPEEIAKLWGARKSKPRMNYDKLSRGLRYYYNKGIMDKVQGKKLTFKYTCDVHNYIRTRNTQTQGGITPRPVGEYRSGSSTPVFLPPTGDGAQEMEDVGEEAIGEETRFYSAGDMPLRFQHTLKNTSEMMGEVVGVVSRCKLPGETKECDLHEGVESDDHSNCSTSMMGGGLCGEAL